MRLARPLPVATLLLLAAVPAAAQSPGSGHEETFRAMTEAINTRDLDRLDDLFTVDFARHSQATPDIEVRSLEDFKAFLRSDFAAVPDSRIRCPMVISEGDLLALEPPAGR